MIVVYYGVNLSLSLPFCLSFSLLFPFLVLCLCHNPHFHFLHRSSINLFQPLPLPSASSSGLSISPRSTCSCFTSPRLFPSSSFGQSRLSFSSGLYFSAPDVPPVANIVFLPPPLDMAKEAICALLAILGHFFEAFSPLDLFFALASFHLASSAFPCFRPSRFPSLSLAALPHQSPLAPSCACRPRAVRTRPLSTHAGFGKPAR